MQFVILRGHILLRKKLWVADLHPFLGPSLYFVIQQIISLNFNSKELIENSVHVCVKKYYNISSETIVLKAITEY